MALSDAEVFSFELAHLAASLRIPLSTHGDPPFGGWCERRDARTFRLKEFLRKEPNKC